MNDTKSIKQTVFCLNCGTECSEKFCPNCGQKTSTSRLQFREMITSVFTSIIGGDNRLLRTCRNLLYRPGHMIREYILGKRTSYYAPMSLLIFLVAVYAIASFIFSNAVSPIDTIRLNLDSNFANSSSAEKFIHYYQLLLGNNVYFSLFSVVLNLVPYRFIFRKIELNRPSGVSIPLNYAEHFFTLIYQSCLNMILVLILLPISLYDEGSIWTNRIYLVLPSIYCMILYRQMLGITWIKSIWYNIKAIVLGICLNFSIIMLIFGILYGYDRIS